MTADNKISLIVDLLDNDDSIEAIEGPTDNDNTYIIHFKNVEIIQTNKLTEYFRVLQISLSYDNDVALFVEPIPIKFF